MPRDYFAPLDLRELFPRAAPLEVDVGCGDGTYLAAIAEQNPEHNFLGFERLVGRVRAACNKIAQRRLENARVLLIEARYAVTYLLPAESVSAFHILFPDPWPKRRHQRRRVLEQTFFGSLARALVTGGVVRIATDQPDYFDEIREAASAVFAVEDADANSFRSTFEQRYEEQDVPVYRLLLRKASRVR